MRAKRGGNNQGRSVFRPHTYAGEYSTPHKYSTIHGISQGEKYIDDIRQTFELEIQVWVGVGDIMLIQWDAIKKS